MTIIEAAKHWNKSRRTIERWLKAGLLEFESEPGGKRIITGVKEIKK